MALSNSSPILLLYRLGVAAALSLIVILVCAGYGISQLYEKHVIDYARNNAISLGQAFVSSERKNLLNRFGLYHSLPVTNQDDLQALNKLIDTFLSPYNILKIKVFSADSQILYSTDHSIIGQDGSGNRRLKIALKGATDSQIQTQEQMLDLSNETRFDVDVVETYVPILDTSHKVIGAFEIYQDMTQEYQKIQQGVFLSVSSLAVILLTVYIIAFYFIRKTALRLLIAQRELEVTATTDPVTNTFNRREILHRAEMELARFKRTSKNGQKGYFGLMMIDIDHFKSINDTYGHPVGDAVLHQVAGHLNSTLRSYCDIGRYGGEEFIAIIPVASHDQAEKIAERMLKTIRNEPFTANNDQISITISIGLVTTDNTEMEFDRLLVQADNYMYQAKSNGRDCYVTNKQ